MVRVREVSCGWCCPFFIRLIANVILARTSSCMDGPPA